MSAPSYPHDTTKEIALVATGAEDSVIENEPQLHVHLRTYLAIFAVCLVYVAQNFAIVGAGAGADYWGRKWFLIIPSIFGVVGCMIIGQASDMPMAIAGFTVLGIAFGPQGLVHAVTSQVLPRRWRPWGQAAAMTSTSLGLVLGLIAAGAVNRSGSANGFRNYYYINAGLFVLAAILCGVAYHPPPTKQQLEIGSLPEKLARLDWVAYALLVGSLVLFCTSLTWSLNPYPWSDAHVSAPFAVSIVLAVALITYEWKFKADGLFHHGLFQNRMFAICLFCVFCEGVAFFAAITYFPFQTNVLYEEDFLLVTVRFAIGFLATLFASLITGLYCATTRKVRLAAFVAFLIFVAFFAGMASTTRHSNTAAWGLPILMGWGLGMTMVAIVTAAQLCVPHALITTASCLLISVRSLGGTVGIAIYQAVFRLGMSHLGDNIAEAAITAGLPASSVLDFVTDLVGQDSTALLTVPGVTPNIIGAGAAALFDTYAASFKSVWVTAITFVGIAAIVSLFMFDPSKEFNNLIDAPVEKEERPYS
ncbi:major facilitator superfamily domain-containing protein [Truncatella angustata]|uniref:Major facilitator superfamily domain-containing protein n=1 Tax=Truncatella angustata TaxID=152316 RepID=A0A9P8UUD6_9PEZI|nr:major facilitator superfamily domain-containing protein [Truncatella angustata]KAH6658528.1 major facilitator superfamily domain-containing protein [Truncatella angustata]